MEVDTWILELLLYDRPKSCKDSTGSSQAKSRCLPGTTWAAEEAENSSFSPVCRQSGPPTPCCCSMACTATFPPRRLRCSTWDRGCYIYELINFLYKRALPQCTSWVFSICLGFEFAFFFLLFVLCFFCRYRRVKESGISILSGTLINVFLFSRLQEKKIKKVPVVNKLLLSTH